MPHPRTVALALLDVNETLFPLDPVAARMVDIGLPGQFELWFTRVLRDGIAASAAGGFAGFRDLAGHHLRELLERDHLAATETEVEHVLAGFDEVVPHADVPEGLLALRSCGIPAVALTNGSAALTRAFLERAGLSALLDGVHDVTEVGRWKPAPEAYHAVLDRRGVAASAAAMIAVHPWDLFGARSAGLVAAWLDRDGTVGYPAAFGAPDVRATTLPELVALLQAHPAG